jgi:Flp pilus assembly protein TadG
MTRDASRRIFRRLRGCRGANLLEAAIITPLLLLVTFAIVDFAAILYVFLALENGVSQASRYGITGNAVSGQSRQNSIMSAMRQATPTLTLTDAQFSFGHLSPGASTWVGGIGGPRDIDKVTVDYTWQLMTPLLRPFFTNGQIRFKVESAMKNEAYQ